MLAVDRETGPYLYRQVIDLISEQVAAGTLRPGDKLPSLRRLSSRLGVSVPTVKQAYIELERQGRVESRPQSGFYVHSRVRNELVRPCTPRSGCNAPAKVRCRNLIDRVGCEFQD